MSDVSGIDVDRGYRPGMIDGDGNLVVSQPGAGVMTRFDPQGIAVHMYWGQPGRYYGDHGQEFPEEFARTANYPVEEYRKQREKMEAMQKAQQAIDSQFMVDVKRKIVEERGEYALIDIGKGRFNIEFSGSVVNAAGPMSRDVANSVLESLAPSPEAPKVSRKA